MLSFPRCVQVDELEHAVRRRPRELRPLEAVPIPRPRQSGRTAVSPCSAAGSSVRMPHQPGVPDDLALLERDERAAGKRGLLAQPFFERHLDGEGHRETGVGVDRDCLVGGAEQLRALRDRDQLEAARNERRRLVAERPHLLDLAVDLPEAEAAREGERAGVPAVYVRRDALEVERREPQDGPLEQRRTDAPAPHVRQDPRRDEPAAGRVRRAGEGARHHPVRPSREQVGPTRVAPESLALLRDLGRLVRRDGVPDRDVGLEVCFGARGPDLHQPDLFSLPCRFA